MSLVQLKRFPCHHCTKDFSRKCHLQAHLDSLAGIKPYACDVCTQRFIRQSDLRTHNSEQHSGRPRLQCHKCSRSFDRKSTLQRHQRRSCKADATLGCHNPGIMTFPYRPSPKPAVASSLNLPSVYPDDPMEVDDDVVSEGASLLLNDTNQTVSSGSSRRFAWSYATRPQYAAGIHVLDTCRPTHQSTLNIDLITINACLYGYGCIIEAIAYPGPLCTEMLSCEYSDITKIAQLGFVRQQMWSQYCCLNVLRIIDLILGSENIYLIKGHETASGAALDSLLEQWDLDPATEADALDVDWWDLVVVRVFQGKVSLHSHSGETFDQVELSASSDFLNWVFAGLAILSRSALLLQTGVRRDRIHKSLKAAWSQKRLSLTSLNWSWTSRDLIELYITASRWANAWMYRTEPSDPAHQSLMELHPRTHEICLRCDL